ncbi:glycosyltransferase family 4 protein [Planctomicrobium sp. SH664]|uniref:glycosyltransferase family 4 protein n=1 Tax=Planctomicrobium sp. SH664 TaxID=3448125 RepID=UPI003F5BFF1F
MSKPGKVLITSGYMETEINAFREIQYSRNLALRGWDVVVYASSQSYIWKHNRAGHAPTNPCANDENLRRDFGIHIVRCRTLLRYADFLLLPIPFRLIREADVVHVIEFRVGHPVIVAAIAKMLGKPVVYDHEQRGDRHYTWLHSIDSLVRRLCIRIGSLFVDTVRHTVHANRDHFVRNRWSTRGKLVFGPLAADERIFHFSPEQRIATRRELNLTPDEVTVVVSGKIEEPKRTPEAIRALLAAGVTVIVVGRVPPRIQQELESIQGGRLQILGHVTPDRLNEIYAGMDYALFTTFSLSYWEAMATGLRIICPRTTFSETHLPKEKAILFGQEAMFVISEEEYDPQFNVGEAVAAVLKDLTVSAPDRATDARFQWPSRSQELDQQYRDLLQIPPAAATS